MKLDKQMIEKRCPECGAGLVVRTNRENDSQFIGCMAWPNCTHTEAIPESLRMRLMGAPGLFDEVEP